jgi:hypothetical protein
VREGISSRFRLSSRHVGLGEEPSSSCQIGGKGARWSNDNGQGDGAGSMHAIVSRVEITVQGNLVNFLSIVIEEVQGAAGGPMEGGGGEGTAAATGDRRAVIRARGSRSVTELEERKTRPLGRKLGHTEEDTRRPLDHTEKNDSVTHSRYHATSRAIGDLSDTLLRCDQVKCATAS